MPWRWTFLALVGVQALHSLEEYAQRLYLVFPPARFVSSLLSSDLATGFAIANVALISLGIWCFVFPIRREWRSAIPLAWFWAVLESINGTVHLAWAVAAGGYRPGAVTAVVLLPLALTLGWQLARRASTVTSP